MIKLTQDEQKIASKIRQLKEAAGSQKEADRHPADLPLWSELPRPLFVPG